MSLARFEISIPPSTNNLYQSFVRKGKIVRVPTDAYKAWKEETALLLRSQGARPLKTPVLIALTIYGGKGFSVQSDVSNRFKAPEDALKEAGVIPDDNVLHVLQTSQRYYPPASSKDKARAVLLVQELEANS